jgi:uncharacterized membrane protein
MSLSFLLGLFLGFYGPVNLFVLFALANVIAKDERIKWNLLVLTILCPLGAILGLLIGPFSRLWDALDKPVNQH